MCLPGATAADRAAASDNGECAARDSVSCTAALIALVEHALDRSDGGPRRTAPARAGSLAAHSPLSETAARSAAVAPGRRT